MGQEYVSENAGKTKKGQIFKKRLRVGIYQRQTRKKKKLDGETISARRPAKSSSLVVLRGERVAWFSHSNIRGDTAI